MKRVIVFLPLLIFIMLAAFFFQQLGKDTQYMPSALIGKPLPQFALVSLESNRVVNQNDLPSKPYLINFWGTWCPACALEHDYLMALAEKGIDIVGIDYKDETAAAVEWLKARGNPYSLVLLDEMGNFGLEMGITGAPETFVVDSKGIIVYRHQGVVNEAVWQTMQGYFK